MRNRNAFLVITLLALTGCGSNGQLSSLLDKVTPKAGCETYATAVGGVAGAVTGFFYTSPTEVISPVGGVVGGAVGAGLGDLAGKVFCDKKEE